jgi:predicted MPP superfamily phosphohydrolase
MRTIVHLSDLHFGRVDQDLLRPLQELTARLAP